MPHARAGPAARAPIIGVTMPARRHGTHSRIRTSSVWQGDDDLRAVRAARQCRPSTGPRPQELAAGPVVPQPGRIAERFISILMTRGGQWAGSRSWSMSNCWRSARSCPSCPRAPCPAAARRDRAGPSPTENRAMTYALALTAGFGPVRRTWIARACLDGIARRSCSATSPSGRFPTLSGRGSLPSRRCGVHAGGVMPSLTVHVGGFRGSGEAATGDFRVRRGHQRDKRLPTAGFTGRRRVLAAAARSADPSQRLLLLSRRSAFPQTLSHGHRRAREAALIPSWPGSGDSALSADGAAARRGTAEAP
ncbi:hypothetical protein ACVWXU_008458 [Streptomyces sp. TE33382]